MPGPPEPPWLLLLLLELLLLDWLLCEPDCEERELLLLPLWPPGLGSPDWARRLGWRKFGVRSRQSVGRFPSCSGAPVGRCVPHNYPAAR